MQKQKGETAGYFFSNDYIQQELTHRGISGQPVLQICEPFLGLIIVYTHGEGF
jgi:hypothetical protein